MWQKNFGVCFWMFWVNIIILGNVVDVFDNSAIKGVYLG